MPLQIGGSGVALARQLSPLGLGLVELRRQLLQLEFEIVNQRLGRVELLFQRQGCRGVETVADGEVVVRSRDVPLGPLEADLLGVSLELAVELADLRRNLFHLRLPLGDQAIGGLDAVFQLGLFLFELGGRQFRQIPLQLPGLQLLVDCLDFPPFVSVVAEEHRDGGQEQGQGARREDLVHQRQAAPDAFSSRHGYALRC